MIKLSNGHEMEYVAASGAFGFDGYGLGLGPKRLLTRFKPFDPSPFTTVILKTITYHPTKGNGYLAIDFIKGGMVNAVKLKNPGIYWWFENVGSQFPDLKDTKNRFVISFTDQDLIVLRLFSEMLVDFQLKLVGMEFNPSCPSTENFKDWTATGILRSCEAMKSYINLPLFLKLSAAQRSLVVEICHQSKGLIDVFDINSVPWNMVFPGQESPLAYLGDGGVSGKAAQEINWNFAQYLSNLSDIPVIWPSMWEERDIARARAHGAEAFSFGSILTLNPFGPPNWIKRDMAERQIQQGKS